MTGLENRVIISTRPISENDTLKDELISKGATLLEMPMIEIVQSELTDEIKSAIRELKKFNWLIFTSKNGAESFFSILKQNSISKEALRTTKIAVIGRKTSESVIGEGFEPFLISSGNTSDDFLEEIRQHIQPGESSLLALGELADTKLEKALVQLIAVTRINVYKTKQPKFYSKEIINKIKNNKYDIILFTSPSGFANFIDILGKEGITSGIRIACIGTTTEKEVIRHGFKPVLVSSKPDGHIFAGEIERYLNVNN